MLDFTRYEVLTFDCYGTLIDWEDGILGAIRPLLARYGITVSDRDILETFAPIEAKHEEGEYVKYRMVLRLVMTELSLRFAFDAQPNELDCLSDSLGDWEPFEDTVDSLTKLRTRYKLAVVSNVDDDLFAQTAKRLRVPFDWVITAQQAAAYKPSREIFDLALRKIGVPRERILHVAQSVYHDIIPAQALGLHTVWVNRRAGKPGSGATLATSSTPLDLEVRDLESLVGMIFDGR